MKICSLLPSATEILFALGLGESVAAVTHECDFPEEATKKPAILRPRFRLDVSAAEMDRQVAEMIERGETIYALDDELLRDISPDLILTQDLCHVCTISPDDLGGALARLAKKPLLLSLTPHTLADVWDDIGRVGEATDRRRNAQALVLAIERRVAAIEQKTSQASTRPRVVCLEWLDPFYVGGHWVPEMVAKAGGVDVLGASGKPSFKVSAEQIARSNAAIIIVMPCGYDAERAAKQWSGFPVPQQWRDLPAIQTNRVYPVDANAYFSRPGPRLSEGIEILARKIHPELFSGSSALPNA